MSILIKIFATSLIVFIFCMLLSRGNEYEENTLVVIFGVVSFFTMIVCIIAGIWLL